MRTSTQTTGANSSELDIAWAAGLFEGEGSVIYKVYGKAHQRRLTLGTTDHDVIQRFQSIAGGVVYGPYTKAARYKPIYTWNECQWYNIVALCQLFYPFLGERRRAALDELLANPPAGTYECRNGHDRAFSVMRKDKVVCRLCEQEATKRKRHTPGLTDIPCACGCGEHVLTSTSTGKPNRFKKGHSLTKRKRPANPVTL